MSRRSTSSLRMRNRSSLLSSSVPGVATTHSRPWLRERTPRAARAAIASRTTVRETPNRSDSSAVDGSESPSRSLSATMRSVSASVTWSASERRLNAKEDLTGPIAMAAKSRRACMLSDSSDRSPLSVPPASDSERPLCLPLLAAPPPGRSGDGCALSAHPLGGADGAVARQRIPVSQPTSAVTTAPSGTVASAGRQLGNWLPVEAVSV